MKTFIALLLFLVASAAAAGLGGAFTASSVGSWYQTLAMPPFAPPDWVFGPVWTLLYIMMAVAAWRVWRAPHGEYGRRTGLYLYAIQLLLNAGWSIAFFGLRNPLLGFVWILVLLFFVAATALAFAFVDRPAAGLMLPYIAWVAFATLLNAGIWILN